MSRILLKFVNQPVLILKINDNDVCNNWLQLVRSNIYRNGIPVFRDPRRYTKNYLAHLIDLANEKFSWDFVNQINSLADTTTLHKHIETSLADGFACTSEEHDDLFHELHYALHCVERYNFNISTGISDIQVEWYNNDGYPLDETFNHQLTLNFGDIKLQNPYVGHIPYQIWQQRDTSNVAQTCRFHDFVRPGFFINTKTNESNHTSDFSIGEYISWWKTNAPAFVEEKTIDRILHYTGHAVIGHVENLDDLQQVASSQNLLEFEDMEIIW